MRVPLVLVVPAVVVVVSAGFLGCERSTPAIVSAEPFLEFERASLHRQPSLLDLSPDWLGYGSHLSIESGSPPSERSAASHGVHGLEG